MIGQTISHYRILEKLGEGGMGEVYLAQDTGPLDRKVALKFPSQEMQQDEAAQKRFLREARSAAALDHPYVCHIHEVGEDGEQSFISMEYVAGQSLKDRLTKGPLELRDALQKATEIAEALEAAHKQNIVHRDLKPANIMLTPEGHVKVMDFGLAKRLVEGGDPDEETVSSTLTDTGATLGTLPYMSPEQVRGQEVDSRSDIFSFGVVLYEMLTGIHPFKRDTSVETATAILNDVSPLVAAHVDNPPVLLQHAVRKMLAKEPNRRYQHVGDVRIDLEESVTEASNSSVGSEGAHAASFTVPAKGMRLPVWRQLLPWGVALLSVVIAIWYLNERRLSEARDSDAPVRTVITLPSDQQLQAGARSYPLDISPDGKRLVYAAEKAGQVQLFIREFTEFDSRPLPGTEGARYPFFSPDSQQVGFFAEGELRKVAVSGEAPLRICDVPALDRGAAWGLDETIIFSAPGQGLLRVPAAGGAPEMLTQIDKVKGEQSHRWPSFLSDGKAVFFSIQSYEGGDMAVISLETGERHMLGHNPRGPAQYLPTGHLVWGEGGGLRAAPFDPAQLEFTGPHVLLLHGVYEPPNTGGLFLAVSPVGTLVYVPGGVDHTLVVVDRSGKATPLTDERRGYRFPRFSPDGRRVAVTVDPPDQSDSDIWLYDVERGTGSPFTSQGHQMTSVWSLDGGSLVYTSIRPEIETQRSRRDRADLYWKTVGHADEAQCLLEREFVQHPESWSPDGSLAFTEHNHGQDDILVLRKDGEVSPFLMSRFDERMPRFSPDGKWLAYVSDESGQDEVYVRPYPGPGRKTLISMGGGRSPEWLADGNELVYRRGGNQMMVAEVETGTTFNAERAKVLFEGRYDATQHGNYDMSGNGQRFVMIRRGEMQFNVVQNWFEDLELLVPTD